MRGRLLALAALAAIVVVSLRGGGNVHTYKPFQPGKDKDTRRKAPGSHRAGPAELALRDRIGRELSQKLSGPHVDLASVPATSWVSLGPTDADQEFNEYVIHGVDSGRPNGIAVHPTNPDIVYMAVSGGGLWKTFNFGSAEPQWNPVTDLQPNLAIGAFAMDPLDADTLYIGNGDFADASGDTVEKSTDGGTTWSTPVSLSGIAPDGKTPLVPLSVHGLGVLFNQVFAATDVGLFTSINFGASFTLTALPNRNGNVPDEMWSVVSTGGSAWVASGVTFCASNVPSTTGIPLVFGGTEATAACPAGNDGVIWYSPDGASWSIANTPLTTGIGRITIGAGSTATPASTVLYAMVGSVDGTSTVGFWRSMDAGHTWLDATGNLINPSLGGAYADCADTNLGHEQSWYNQSVSVDPTNPAHVLVGGNLCGARTLDGISGSPSWELISDWLPNPVSGATSNGVLPYVHADWHTSTTSLATGSLVVFAGTDGGIFTSTDVFDPNTPGEQVQWINHNHGLVTHLVYQLGTGDQTTQDPFILIAGTQDNGTRYRADPNNPSVFNQPFGGDGIGATVHHGSSGTTYWCSAEETHGFCQPSSSVDCSQGSNWYEVDPAISGRTSPAEHDGPPGAHGEDDDDDEPLGLAAQVRAKLHEDSEPFFVHYANVETDTRGQSVLTHTNEQVWVAGINGSGNLAWTAISQDLTNDPNGEGFASVTASRVTPGLYGAAGLVSLAPFFVSTTGNAMSTWVAASPVTPTGTIDRLTGASSIDFPPTLGVGQNPGDVFIGSFTGTMNDANRTPPPDNMGHLYRTEDGGKTWTSIVGQSSARQLPNVPVYVAKYDPIVATTIYAATDVGVYITTDDGADWDRMGVGLPIISTRDIYVAKNQGFIRAATYGRGIWEIYPSAAESSGTPGNGDFDRNLAINWIDVAALSARLGETPMDTTPPYYTWIDDIVQSATDPTAQIDDGDLAALLDKFAGQP
jgi:hypothetical protein